ncbi:MAG: Peptidoglycan O-acetyltransferase [Bacteroidetes bacterium ADurb.Bin408]|nr:MAG: Peptidoglycan O-acetyltransferase [Bacteroidetes bacterium ADurb.Bin408]
MGFRLNKNFDSPYKARNVGEFWKRWHISLSTWLKDYLYIPLGGNRKGKLMANVNLMITMLLGGFWHGANWQFVIWGGLNGAGLVVYKYWKKISPWEKSKNRLSVIWKIMLTFCFITFTRVWFRSESLEIVNAIFYQIGHNFKMQLIPSVLAAYYPIFLMMLFGYVLHWLPYAFKDKVRNAFIAAPLYVKVMISVAVVFVIYQSLSSELQPFVYFQF